MVDQETVRTEDQEMIQGLSPFPFTKVIWHSVDQMQEWGPILKRAAGLHDKAEYEMVKLGHRACATLHLSPSTYDKWIERIQSDGLVWLPIQWTKNYSGFAHQHYPTKPGDPDSSVYGVLARNIRDAEEFREASSYYAPKKNVDHETIGRLLGFPECCVKAFCEWWPRWVDPVNKAAEASPHEIVDLETHKAIKVTPHVATNQMLRYSGYRLTSHFPCSLNCEASKEVGKVWLDTCKKIDPKGTEYLLRILTLPGEWSCLHGIAQVETPHFTIVTNSMPTRKKIAVKWDEVENFE